MPAAALVTDASTPRLDLEHAYPRHPERPERLSAILDHLDASGLRERMVQLAARDATDDEILAVHERRVLDVQADLAGRGGGLTDPDTYITPSSPAAARRAAGAALVALEAVLAGDVTSAFAAVRPPGHHATRETMMGFCLLNNVAIAATGRAGGGRGARWPRARRHRRLGRAPRQRHAGDLRRRPVTALLQHPRRTVLPRHRRPPRRRNGRGGGHEDQRAPAARRGRQRPPRRLRAHRAAGAGALSTPDRVRLLRLDAHARDPLAPLNVTTTGYTRVARMVLDAAGALCDGRVVVALEGGYDPHALAWCAGALCELLLGEEPAPDPEPAFADGAAPPEPDVTQVIDAARGAVGLT